MLVLLTVIVSAFGVLVSVSAGIYQKQIERFPLVPRKPFMQAYSPITLGLRGRQPNSASVPVAAPRIHAISMSEHNIDLYAAGREVRSIHLTSPVRNIRRLVKLVHDRAWIAETAPSQITLKSALTVAPGVDLRVGGRHVHEVRMLSIPNVFIGTNGGKLDFTRVKVEAVSSTIRPASYYKPFIMATDGAVMNVTNCTFKGLGWDWKSSYGSSWEDGSTGRVTGTTFEDGFIGVYTVDAHDMLFRNDVFRGNALYGLDPHSYSRGLIVDHVLAEDNQAHGIIFSNHVTHSIIERSISKDNGEDGIIMDELSTHNRIIGNRVIGNRGDGLVTSRSPYNTFSGNVVVANRVGISLGAGDADHTTLTGNKLDGNALVEQHALLNSTNATAGNGGQWDLAMVVRIWICVISVTVLVATGLAVLPRLRLRRIHMRVT